MPNYDAHKLYLELKRDEGLRPHIYTDTVGKVTVGIGRNLTDRDLSMDEIKLMYDNDIANCVAQLNTYVTWWWKLNDVRQRVLINMCFNLGIRGLLGFKNTLKYIENGDYKQAAVNMLKSKWATQVGQRAVRLAKMMEEGVSV